MNAHNPTLYAGHREYGRKSAGGGDDAAGLVQRELTRIGGEVKTALGTAKERMQEHDQRLTDLEQRAARRGSSGPAEVKTLGQQFVEHPAYRDLETRDREGLRIHVKLGNDPLERKNITSAPNSGGTLIAPDYRLTDPSMLPWNANTVRSLVAPGQTGSNAVFYPRQTSRTNAAAPQAGEGALKAQSDVGFEQVMAPVQTLAHYFLISRQSLDDAPALASMIDSEARSGLKDKEDAQLLFGDGTGQNLFGLCPQASAFVKQWTATGGTGLDVLIQAIAQVEAQNYLCDGVVLNAVDWRQLQSIKDTQGRYIGNGPFDPEVLKRIWNTPTAATNRMPRGKFLVGPFGTQAQIFDRMDVEVLLSTEDADNFRRNLVTARCEERLAFTVKRPESFVYGDLGTSLAA